jgi:outer membrane protein OmpA-like peptidoglycan-associated protein|tara:strand:+ start:808 stop:1449 length:642 start_codon:yes stop_codon:yes gene_type:complete
MNGKKIQPWPRRCTARAVKVLAMYETKPLNQVSDSLGHLLAAALLTASILISISTGHAGTYRNLNEVLQELRPETENFGQTVPQRSIDHYVTFRSGSSELSEIAKHQLDELGGAISHPSLAKYGFIIAGHTDASGPVDYNKRLYQARAATVKSCLMLKHGAASNRLTTIGWGEERLKIPLHPRDASNGKVEITAIPIADTKLLPGQSKGGHKW